MKHPFVAVRLIGVGTLAAFGLTWSCAIGAQGASELATVPRHALETQALKDPDGVLRELPGLLDRATAARDFKELAMLQLARANACRVIADWPCQANAAAVAQKAAESARLPDLQARGLIVEGSSRIAMQDFSRAAQLLGTAERLLKQYPFPELTADMYLVYSSLSHTVGKHAVAADYAGRGLAALGDRPALLIRVRLLRNQGRAIAHLGNTGQARDILKQALVLVEQIQDPKLSAELHLEGARVARLMNDVPSQIAAGRQILGLGTQLGNSQLKGMGHEVLGQAALQKGDRVGAERELRLAHTSFRELKLERDERRVLRALIRSVLGRPRSGAELETLAARSIALEASLEGDDRTMAADDFEARIKYAQQESDLQRLEAAAVLAAQRESALADRQRLTLIAATLTLVLLLVLGVFFVVQHRLNSRLRQLIAQSRESESRYRMLAEYSHDMVVRMRPDGHRLYVSPACKDLLGLEPADFIEPRWDLVHPDDRDHLAAKLRELVETGGSATVSYRARHANGDYVWLEGRGRLVLNQESGGQPEIIYAARDITQQKVAEAKLDRLARMDSLSGVANRRYFEERFAAAFARSRRQGTALALLCLDIDRFKAINDQYGHPAGDEVIIAFAGIMQSCVREDDLVARMGGDEFVLLIENPEPESGESVARKLLALMQQPIIVDGHSLEVSASIGVAYSLHPPSTKALMDLADRALYSAKAAGRNTYRVAAES